MGCSVSVSVTCESPQVNKPHLIIRVIPGRTVEYLRLMISCESQRLAWMHAADEQSSAMPTTYCTERACEQLSCACAMCNSVQGWASDSWPSYCAEMVLKIGQLTVELLPTAKAHLAVVSQIDYLNQSIVGCVCSIFFAINTSTKAKSSRGGGGRRYLFGLLPTVFEAPASDAYRAVKMALALCRTQCDFVLIMVLMDKSVILIVGDEAQVFHIDSLAMISQHTDALRALLAKAQKTFSVDDILKRVQNTCGLIFRIIDRNDQRGALRKHRLVLKRELADESDPLSADVMTAFAMSAFSFRAMEGHFSQTRRQYLRFAAI